MNKKKDVLVVKDNENCEGIIKTGFTFNDDEVLKKVSEFESVELQLAYLSDCFLMAQKQLQEFENKFWEKYSDDPVYINSNAGVDEYRNSKKLISWQFAEFSAGILPHIEVRRKILKIPKEKGSDKKIEELQDILIKSKMREKKPIQWTGTKEQLAKAIDTLVLKNCIPEDRKYQSFAEHFQWYNKKTEKFENITNKELGVLSNRKIAETKKAKDLTGALNKKLS